jgi:hypothetical protein
MANTNITNHPENIYAHVRDTEHEHLKCLFELSEKIFDYGHSEGWIPQEDYDYFLTMLEPAKELQREGLQRLIGHVSRFVIVGRSGQRIPYSDYLHYINTIELLSSMIRNELEMYGGKKVK